MMTRYQIADALQLLRPKSEYSIGDDAYESINWRDPQGRAMPTKAEVEAANARADVPQEVWAGAMMRALNTLGILEQIDQIVAAENDLLAKRLWDRATAFRRDDPMISVIGGKAGWSENDLDDLFRLAGSFNS
jgi:hypothetical protein